MRRKMTAVAGVLVLSLSLSAIVAQAGAHGFGHGWHHRFFGQGAVVAGTVTSLGAGSFDANAYVLTPGAGGSSASATTTPVTITEGTDTKVVTVGQAGVAVGDSFYATYAGQPDTTPIATLVAGSPTKIFAYVAPTAEVEVSGVITAVDPASDQFTATASVVPGHGGGASWSSQGGQGFGHAHSHSELAHRIRSHCENGSSSGTPNTIITTDSGTTFDVDGTSGSAISDLAIGQKFTASFDGTPGETLAEVIANPAISVAAQTAQTPNSLYAFVGTVTATDTTGSPQTVTATVTESTPSGLFTGTDTFDVGSSTFVFGGGGSLGSLSSVSVGDVVAGGLFSAPGQTAGAIEADPLQVLIDFPASSSSSSAAALHHAQRLALRKAMRLLRKQRIGVGGKHRHRVRFDGADHKKR